MIDWPDILENGVGPGAWTDPAETRDVLARALSAELKT
jgi:hypothetical protein